MGYVEALAARPPRSSPFLSSPDAFAVPASLPHATRLSALCTPRESPRSARFYSPHAFTLRPARWSCINSWKNMRTGASSSPASPSAGSCHAQPLGDDAGRRARGPARGPARETRSSRPGANWCWSRKARAPAAALHRSTRSLTSPPSPLPLRPPTPAPPPLSPSLPFHPRPLPPALSTSPLPLRLNSRGGGCPTPPSCTWRGRLAPADARGGTCPWPARRGAWPREPRRGCQSVTCGGARC